MDAEIDQNALESEFWNLCAELAEKRTFEDLESYSCKMPQIA